MEKKIKVSVLLTCHNRCQLTSRCLRSILKAQSAYNSVDKNIDLHFFITDDACSDDTVSEAENILGKKLTIIKADGSAFWAGGMRLAWEKAIKINKCDYYLLLNDDTEVWENLFFELLSSHEYAMKHYGKGGIYSGNTSWFHDNTKITFGGKVVRNRVFCRFRRLIPSGYPQRCDIVNANILMVTSNVVEQIGIFPSCYIHGAADNDYGMRANHAGFPVLITAGFCGSCDADNYNISEEKKKMCSMNLAQRKSYFSNPVHSVHDTIEFYKRWGKSMLPAIWLMHMLQVYIPSFYYKIRYKI